MPIIKHFSSDLGRKVAIWEKTETEEELLDIAELIPVDQIKYNHIKLNKRKMEWLTAKVLMKSIGFDHTYSILPSGKPYINEHFHFSITHSLPYVGIIEHSNSVGIDIQKPEDKMLRIQHKYCHPQEIERVKDHEHQLEMLSIIWSAKEAVFKVYGENIHFADQLLTHPFDITDRIIQCDFKTSQGVAAHRLGLLKVNDHFCVHSL
ncbi:MAG: 4'-phosphopantetheinyl transferase superfamily protein [Flavobacteriales bacterium]|nr:4'-phosphopantetheinyl transferase superfamily protein [Flavobacteriales bacterium]